MIPRYEIFRLEKDDSLVWCDAVHTLDTAKGRIALLTAKTPSQYVIFNRVTIECIRMGSADDTTRKPPQVSPLAA